MTWRSRWRRERRVRTDIDGETADGTKEDIDVGMVNAFGVHCSSVLGARNAHTTVRT